MVIKYMSMSYFNTPLNEYTSTQNIQKLQTTSNTLSDLVHFIQTATSKAKHAIVNNKQNSTITITYNLIHAISLLHQTTLPHT